MNKFDQIPIEIHAGKLEVFSSGIIHTAPDTPLRLKYGSGEMLEMEFIFKSDDGKARWDTEISGDKLSWHLYNFTNPIGQGVLRPIPLGTLEGRKLYCSFFVLNVDPKSDIRAISYNLLLGEEVKNEQV